MSIDTFPDLMSALQNLFDDSASLDAARVKDAISMGEALINRRVRGREMETSADMTISSRTTALPTGFVQARRFYLNTDPIVTLGYMPPNDFWMRNGVNQTAQPVFFTIEAGNLVVAPTPSSSITGKMLYYKKSDIASALTTLFSAHPDMYLYAAGIYAADFLDDDRRMLKCTGMFEQIVSDYDAADEGDRYGGAPLVTRSLVSVDDSRRR